MLERGKEIDRKPIFGRNKPYAPAEGECVTLNPPSFLWLPSGEEVLYRLRVCREKSFAGPTLIAFDGLKWCCKMLTQPLAAGEWYWQYGVFKEGTETLWSKARRFTVAETATPWVYPGRDSFAVPQGHPRLFVTPDGLPGLRRRAAEGDLKGTAERLVKSVKRVAGEDLVAEPEWLPKDRTQRGKAYSLVIHATRPPMDVMERAGLAYLLTGDPACGAEAKRRILHFFGWDPNGPSGVFHNDEPAMWVMMRGIRAYDWTYELFTAEERAKVEASMRERAAGFYKLLSRRPFENNPYESHAGRILGFLGEAALEFLPEWPEARVWLDYVTQIFWGVYPAWGKEDGGWNEGPGYWSHYMKFALHYVLALREGTGVDLAQRPFFQSTPFYQLYLSPPYSQMSPFGDGTQFRRSQPAELMYWFSTLNRSPEIRWYASELERDSGDSILGVVLKDDSISPRAPSRLPQARHFEGVGLVCLHTDFGNGANDISFAMRSSPYGAVSHGHNDQNCFTLEAFGEALAIPSGYYPRYSSPHHDQWTRQTKAKCGVTYDGGQGQDRGWQAQGRIAEFIHGEAFDLVVGDATKAYGGRLTRAIREVVHVRPGIFVIRDDVASEEPRRFEFQLHALDQMSIDEGTATVMISRPKASLKTSFLLPKDPGLTQTDQFDPPPAWPPGREYANNWHATASLREPAKEAQFLTVLMPAKAGEEDLLPQTVLLESDTAVGVELRYADGRRTIVAFAKTGQTGTCELGGISGRGSCFAASFAAAGTLSGQVASRVND